MICKRETQHCNPRFDSKTVLKNWNLKHFFVVGSRWSNIYWIMTSWSLFLVNSKNYPKVLKVDAGKATYFSGNVLKTCVIRSDFSVKISWKILMSFWGTSKSQKWLQIFIMHRSPFLFILATHYQTLMNIFVIHCQRLVTWRSGEVAGGELARPLLKGDYTGHEKTYFGDLDISPRLAETKRKQKISEKSGLPIFLGGSWFSSGKNDQKLAVKGSRPHILSPSGAVNFSNALLYWMFRD